MNRRSFLSRLAALLPLPLLRDVPRGTIEDETREEILDSFDRMIETAKTRPGPAIAWERVELFGKAAARAYAAWTTPFVKICAAELSDEDFAALRDALDHSYGTGPIVPLDGIPSFEIKHRRIWTIRLERSRLGDVVLWEFWRESLPPEPGEPTRYSSEEFRWRPDGDLERIARVHREHYPTLRDCEIRGFFPERADG